MNCTRCGNPLVDLGIKIELRTETIRITGDGVVPIPNLSISSNEIICPKCLDDINIVMNKELCSDNI